jgi:transcriptional regulator with XRE-family HTH domain
MTFGERLRQLRRERQMNQRTLAARVGIDFTYLSKIENGRMEPPSAETIVKLAQALGANPDELLLLAKKLPQDLTPVITQSPQWPAFLRSIRDLTDDELQELSAYAQAIRGRRVRSVDRPGAAVASLENNPPDHGRETATGVTRPGSLSGPVAHLEPPAAQRVTVERRLQRHEARQDVRLQHRPTCATGKGPHAAPGISCPTGPKPNKPVIRGNKHS